MLQPHNQPVAAPQLNIVAVNQAPRLGYGLYIVAADHRLKADKMIVVPDDIGSVFWHRPGDPAWKPEELISHIF